MALALLAAWRRGARRGIEPGVAPGRAPDGTPDGTPGLTWRAAALALLPAAAWELFRLLYYGAPLPNPYYAKATGALGAQLSEGWLYVAPVLPALALALLATAATAPAATAAKAAPAVPDATAAAAPRPSHPKFRFLDLMGLSDEHLAQRVPGRRHHKSDPEYVLGRRPDLIVLNSWVRPGEDGRWQARDYSPVEAALRAHPDFARLYRPVPVFWERLSSWGQPAFILLYEIQLGQPARHP